MKNLKPLYCVSAVLFFAFVVSLLIILYSCSSIKITSVQKTDQYQGRISEIEYTLASEKCKNESMLVYADSCTFRICGWHNYVQIGDEVWIRILPGTYEDDYILAIIEEYIYPLK